MLTVRVPDDGVDRVTSILELHNPIESSRPQRKAAFDETIIHGKSYTPRCSPTSSSSPFLPSTTPNQDKHHVFTFQGTDTASQGR